MSAEGLLARMERIAGEQPATEEAWRHVGTVGANAGLVLLALARLQDLHRQTDASPGQVSRLAPFAESTCAGTLRLLAEKGVISRRRGPHQRVTYRIRLARQDSDHPG